MKIAILGSASSSLGLAPHSSPEWSIWGCSPGVYPYTDRMNAWFELHRWEPGVVGKAGTQKAWFSPEYVQWMAKLACPVWMQQHVREIPTSRALPVEELVAKYGSYFFTSSVAWMIACAIEEILEHREQLAAKLTVGSTGHQPVNAEEMEPDVIGLWGIDMSATEEYGYQRAGCQHFLLLAGDLGIQIYVPPESDLLRPMPLYGICEGEHWHIKAMAHQRELEVRLANAKSAVANATQEQHFVAGAMSELNYQMLTWGESREGIGTSFKIAARSPRLQQAVELLRQPAKQEPTAAPGTQAGKSDEKPLTAAHRGSKRARKR